MSTFYEKKENFWEYEWPFGELLQETFPEGSYRRKFSMTGHGIYNLITLMMVRKLFAMKLKIK